MEVLRQFWHWLITPNTGKEGRSLPWMFLGRQVRPFSLGMSLYSAFMAFAILSNSAMGQLLDGDLGAVIGAVAMISSILMWIGWWGRSVAYMSQGLLLATASTAAVAGTLFAEFGPWVTVSPWLSVSVAVMSGGAYLLEVNDSRERQ